MYWYKIFILARECNGRKHWVSPVAREDFSDSLCRTSCSFSGFSYSVCVTQTVAESQTNFARYVRKSLAKPWYGMTKLLQMRGTLRDICFFAVQYNEWVIHKQPSLHFHTILDTLFLKFKQFFKGFFFSHWNTFLRKFLSVELWHVYRKITAFFFFHNSF